MTPPRLIPFQGILPAMLLALTVLALSGCFRNDDDPAPAPAPPENSAPSFTSGSAMSVGEKVTATGYTASATDAEGDTITFSLSGGADQAAFSLNGDSGVLVFNSAPDFDAPSDSDGNNDYEVEISASDGSDTVVQSVTITVLDVADHAGYYINSGTASVLDDASGTVGINDLQGMVSRDGSRIIMMSAAEKLLYDGTITSITGNDFSAVFTFYTDGENPLTLNASGLITAGSGITGTLAGTGAGSGTFSLLYANTNDQAVTMVDMAKAWRSGEEEGVGFDEFGFIIDATGNLTHDKSAGPSRLFGQCDMNGEVAPLSGTRLYRVNVALTTCNNPEVNGTYTGLTTPRDVDAPNDRLVFVVSDGRYGFGGEFNID